MVPAIEILVNSPNVRQLLLDADTQELDKVMQNDTYYGMQSFNQALLQLVRDGVATEEDALLCSSTPEDLKLGLRGVSRRSGAGSMDDDFGGPRRGGRSSGKGGIQRGFEF
jgi:twitching motility protein PilT